MSIYEKTVFNKEDNSQVTVRVQDKTSRNIVGNIMKSFSRMQRNRDAAHNQFRGRNLIDYINDSQARFNNWREKPDWKEDWQANISDITTHTQLMAIAAGMVVNRVVPHFSPRFSPDVFSQVFASIYQNLYQYIDTVERNGAIDDLFSIIKMMRDGTVLEFQDYQDNDFLQGVDVRFIPLAEAFPVNIREFEMKKQGEFIWRPIIPHDEFRATHSGKIWRDVKLVKKAGAYNRVERDFFDVSDIMQFDSVEKIIYFNTIKNEFGIVANGVLITPPNLKMTDVFKSKGGKPYLPISKGVGEPYDTHFFYGRSLPDLMRDNQDAIDFLFNAMFDREILTTMRPILVGGVNDLAEDFWSPGSVKNVMDVNQVKELGFDGADLNAFRILKELQDRNIGASIDKPQQGISLGRKTATEVAAATQAQQLKNAMSNILFGDFQLQRARIRKEIIRHHYIRNDKFKPFIIDNVKLSNGRVGKRIIEITKKVSERNGFGFSPTLMARNILIRGESEILQVHDRELKDFEVNIAIDLEPQESNQVKRARVRDYITARIPIALQRPDLLNAEALLKREAEDIPGLQWDDVKGEAKRNPLQDIGGPDAEIPSLSAGRGAGAGPAPG